MGAFIKAAVAAFRRLAPLLILICAPEGAEAHITAELAKALAPPGYDVGRQDPKSFAFPLEKAGLVQGYIFDTLDYAPVPGFSGTPMELVVALDPQGTIMDVHLIHQNEPLFVDGMGVEPFLEFLKQYRGKQIRQNITVGSVTDSHPSIADGTVVLDGITKASASTRIANVTILTSALSVARTHFSGSAPSTGSKVKAEYQEALDWPELIRRGYVQVLRLKNEDVQQAFAATDAIDDDLDAKAAPNDLFTEIYFSMADIPTVGVAVFGEDGYRTLMSHLDPGDHAIIVFTNGRWLFTGGNFIRGNRPQRLTVEQGGFAFAARDMAIPIKASSAVPNFQDFAVLRISGSAGLDPSAQWSVSAAVSREHGLIYPEVIVSRFAQAITLPAKFFSIPKAHWRTDWIKPWGDQWRQIGFVVLLLTVLTAGLVFQRRFVRNKLWFSVGRWMFLAIVLVWVGWLAQGQLSIVTVLGLVKAVFHGADLGFLLYDPISLVLWGYTVIALMVWGRGSFCGWLCPFGALQEFAALAGRALRLPRRSISPGSISPGLGRLGIRLKYAVLIVLVAGTAWDSALAEVLAEAEPFKTAITLGFHRDGATTLYAIGLVVWAAFVFKPFCRFLCPLGATFALFGRARRWNWIARRAECGSPCRLCERRCAYGAITAAGAVDYAECFQCLDCVRIYHDNKACVPLILEERRSKSRPEQHKNPSGEIMQTAAELDQSTREKKPL